MLMQHRTCTSSVRTEPNNLGYYRSGIAYYIDGRRCNCYQYTGEPVLLCSGRMTHFVSYEQCCADDEHFESKINF